MSQESEIVQSLLDQLGEIETKPADEKAPQNEGNTKKRRGKSNTITVPGILLNENRFAFPIYRPDGYPPNLSVRIDSPFTAAQYDRAIEAQSDTRDSLVAYLPDFRGGMSEHLQDQLNRYCVISEVIADTMLNGEQYAIVNHLHRAEIIRNIGADVVVRVIRSKYRSEEQEESLILCSKLTELMKRGVNQNRLASIFPEEIGEYTLCGDLADLIASTVLSVPEHKAKVFLAFNPIKRAQLTLELLEEELQLLEMDRRIEESVQNKLNKAQRDYYLREHMHAIEQELGQGGESYSEKIKAADLPEEVSKKLLQDASKIDRMSAGSPDLWLMTNYLDTVLALPWHSKTEDRLDLSVTRAILDRDHDGMEKIKDRIVEYIAVKMRNPNHKNQILCLVGPPGVGKTSVIYSIAEAMNRKCVRVSLGGIRDESDIRGHRKTYIGAMPGRIMEGISRAGSSNPVMMLDELDKMTRDAHGDPGAALLEVLDAEQNKFFRDHFMEVPFDLSDTVFIATANTLDTVPRPLIDRMEIIEMHSYTKTEKIRIARNHLIPKQMSRHGLSELEFSIRDDTLETIIDEYTHEAGVRNLERQLATLIRKIVTRLEKKEIHPPVEVSPDDLTGYLGPNKNLKTHISEQDEIGVVNGLAYTETGGELLKVEAAVLDGTGKIELTGSLGEVMKESARLAVSYVRSIAKDYDIDPDFYKNKDIHIHFPEGATPKDGPSAGVTMVTALISALTNRPVRRDIAMTGEITLRGNVLPIGGLREKTMGAYTAGVKTVFLPQANRPDLAEIDKEAGSHLDFVPVSTVGQILDSALVAKA